MHDVDARERVGSARRVVVTGATSGIGEATVRLMRALGFDVLAIARREERLRRLQAESGCAFLAGDVRDVDALLPRLLAFAPDVLVNNAGVGHGIDGLASLDGLAIQEAVDVNVVAPIRLTAAVLPGMEARGGGHVVNIGSIAGLHTLVSALYGATKSAVHRFSQNLRVELRGTGVRVTEICPGRVETEFYDAAVGDLAKLQGMKEVPITALRPVDIADAIAFAVQAPAHVNVATIELLPTEQAVGGVTATPAANLQKESNG